MTRARCVLIIITCESPAPGLRRLCTLDAITAKIIAAGKSDLMSTFRCTSTFHIVGGGGSKTVPFLSCAGFNAFSLYLWIRRAAPVEQFKQKNKVRN